MYIIEKIIRLYLKYKNKEKNIELPSMEDRSELEDPVTCSHNFLPIDSTGQILACSKCGFVVRKSKLKKD